MLNLLENHNNHGDEDVGTWISILDEDEHGAGFFIGEFENGMKRVNPRNLYLLGMRLHRLRALQIGTTIENNSSQLRSVCVALLLFAVDEDFGVACPNAAQAADNLILYVRDDLLLKLDVTISPYLKEQIEKQVARFESALEIDIDVLPIFLLEEKRGLNPKTLLGAVQKLIPTAGRPYLSEFAMTNLQDAAASLVFDHFTASGFHTMRAVEDVARYYYEIVTGISAVTVKANGERSYLTLGQIAWKLEHEVLKTLRSARTPTGKLGLIGPTLTALCEIYRNPLSHPEIVKLEEDDGIDVLNKGLDVIATMIRDVRTGGQHFSARWADWNFSWTWG